MHNTLDRQERRKRMKNVPMEKLTYLLQHLEGYIENMVYAVLADSEEDPQYSAVTATNLIKCHIEVEEALGRQLPYHNVEEYLRCSWLTEEEMQVFEKKRQHESAYYHGKQY